MLSDTQPLIARFAAALVPATRRLLLAVLGTVAAVVLVACATSAPNAGTNNTTNNAASAGTNAGTAALSDDSVANPLNVYASFFPIADIVKNVAGDYADVHSFMPVSQDPHLWEPTPRDIQKLAEADLLVVNGANMEPWLPQVRQAVPNVPVLNLSDFVELITYKGAAALGEFQYMAATPMKAGKKYSIIFGHTHEKSMRVAFFPRPQGASESELIERGRAALSEIGDTVAQKRNISVEPDRAYSIEMGHESGEVSFTVPDDGDWVFVSDHVSEDILPYELFQGREKLSPVPVIEGGSSATDEVSFDPHSWLSLVNAKRYANAVAEKLVELRPDDEYEIRRQKGKFVSSITTLEAEFKERFKAVSRREFVVGHNAFGYLARDFELTQHPVQGLTSTDAPSLRSLINIIRLVRELDIKVIYYEYGQEEKSAKTIADEVGGRTLPLASLEQVEPAEAAQFERAASDGSGVSGDAGGSGGSGGSGDADGSGGHGYVDFMRMNLENLYESLK